MPQVTTLVDEAPTAVATPVQALGPGPRPAVAGDMPLVVIEPTRGWVSLQLADLWRYRELLYFLTWRDLKVRYKQTVLGVTWAVIQPFFTMIVFTIFFGHLLGVDSGDAPYAVFSYVALVPWFYFAQALTQSSNSLVQSASLIRKVYFPRLVIPVSSVMSGVVDFFIAFTIVLALFAYYRLTPAPSIVLMPVFLLLCLLTALGVSLWLSAMNVKYRDVRYVVPFLTQFWFFVSPIVYSSRVLDEPWRTVYGLNPMVGVVEGFRWSLLGAEAPLPMIALSFLSAAVLVVTGAYYFRRMERTFADVV